MKSAENQNPIKSREADGWGNLRITQGDPKGEKLRGKSWKGGRKGTRPVQKMV